MPSFTGLELNGFGYRSRRTAFRGALPPNMDILRLRAIAAGYHHNNIFRPIRNRNHAVAGQLQVRPALHPLVESFFRHFTHAMTRPLPNKLLHVGFAKTVAGDNLRMLRANHHDRFRSRRSIHAAGEIGEYAFALRTVEIRRAHGAIGADSRHRTGVGGKPALDVKRFPRARFFVFRNAKTVFSRPAERRLTGGSGIGTADVTLDEANATADGGVGTPTFAENV